MFRFRSIAILCLLLTFEAFPTSFGLEAFDGLVVTKLDTIRGKVEVDLVRNIVTVREGTKYHSIVASQVRKVIINEPGNPRGYFSGSFGADGHYILFEILSMGNAILLFREGVKFSQFDEESFPPYFVSKENSIYSVNSKKEFLSHLEDKAEAVKDFVKANKISFTKKADLVSLFHFYNGISSTSEMFALKD